MKKKPKNIRELGSFKRNPKFKNRVDFSGPASADILSMIRSRQNDDHIHYVPAIEEDNQSTFHDFEQLDHAANSFGLYREIVKTYKDETDPDKLKEVFEENLTIILERMPDGVAQSVSAALNGITH